MNNFLKKNRAIIYDTRSAEKFYQYHFNGSINISPINLKHIIIQHNIKAKIVLVHDFERTNLNVVSWARWKGYKNVYVFHLKPELHDNAMLRMNKFI